MQVTSLQYSEEGNVVQQSQQKLRNNAIVRNCVGELEREKNTKERGKREQQGRVKKMRWKEREMKKGELNEKEIREEGRRNK